MKYMIFYIIAYIVLILFNTTIENVSYMIIGEVMRNWISTVIYIYVDLHVLGILMDYRTTRFGY